MKHNKLRVIAVTLIVLPEPFTTVLGVMLLLFSFLLPKRHKETLRELEDLVRRYRNYSKNTGSGRVGPSSKPGVPQTNTLKIIHHVLRTSLPQSEAAPNLPAKVLNHTLNKTIQPPPGDVFYSRLRPNSPDIQPQSKQHINGKNKSHRAVSTKVRGVK